MGASATFKFNYGMLEVEASYEGSYSLSSEFSQIPKQLMVAGEFGGEYYTIMKVQDFLEYFENNDPGYYALVNFIKILKMAYNDTSERASIMVNTPSIPEFANHPKRGSYKECILMVIGD